MELNGHRQFHGWSDASECHVGALVVVRLQPSRGLVLRLGDRVEQRSGQPGVANGTVVAFNVGVLLRLARQDMLAPAALQLCPCQQRTTDVFGTVVAAKDARLAAPLDDLLQRPDYPGRRQRQVDFDPQSLCVVVNRTSQSAILTFPSLALA